jgi:hypothetical protein
MGQARGGRPGEIRGGKALRIRLRVEIPRATQHINSSPATMNLPSDTPRLPKLVFFVGWAALLATAWIIWDNAAHPTTGLALVSVVCCVALASVLVAIPFVTDYASRQDEALDNRQRSLQALSVTVAAAAEQVSIAATGLQGIAEAAQENFSKSERLAKQIQEKMAELEARLATAKRDDGEVAARYEAAAKKISKTAGEFEAAVSRASEAAQAAAAIPRHIPELPPVIASRIAEIRPAVAASDSPFVAAPVPVERPARAPRPEPVAAPAAEPIPAQAAEPSLPPEPAAPEAPASQEPAPAPPAPRKCSPRKPAAPPPPAADLVLESPPADESLSAPEIAEPAVSADGATRLIVTAYIGIGNRLFIRGEGPGLTWEKGVPLAFVSIGKWRWDTSDATAAVRFKLYKNDETECSALGERSVEPGAQQELTASF